MINEEKDWKVNISKMYMTLWLVVGTCNLHSLVFGFQFQIPSNFYGSSEVFSGYLSNSEVFIEAFTLQDDHVSISGSIPEVERALESIDTTGNKNRPS